MYSSLFGRLCGLFFIVGFFITNSAVAANPAAEHEEGPPTLTVESTVEVPTGEEQVWTGETSLLAEHLYPSLWGQVGIFRVRSAYSLPEDTLTFGIAGEFYSVGNA